MKFNSPIQFCISCWKVAGTLQSPKAFYHTHRTLGYPWWKQCTASMPRPSWSAKIQISDPGRKSGQCLLSSLAPLVFGVMGRNPSLYEHSSIRKLMQKCKPPSFFLTSMTALHQALWLGLMVHLDSNISLRWSLTSSTIGGGIHLNHSLNGVSSVTFMVCSVEWVHPSSARSNENTSWYLARSQWASSANSGAHESKPLKSNSSNSLPCLCLIVNFGVWGSGYTSSWTCRLPGSGILGTSCTAIALATGVFFWRVWG